MKEKSLINLILQQFSTSQGIHDFINRFLAVLLAFSCLGYFASENNRWIFIVLILLAILVVFISRSTLAIWLKNNHREVPRYLSIAFPYRYLISIQFLVLIAIIFFYPVNTPSNNQFLTSPVVIPKTQIIETPQPVQFPSLNLDVTYFNQNDVQWGSADYHEKYDDIRKFSKIALNNKAVYQSYPSTKIVLTEYSNGHVPLKVKTINQIRNEQKIVEPDGWGDYRIEENYKEYGQLATNYLPENYIQSIDKFDVDEDGRDETIITHNIVAAADRGSYTTDIIKNNSIIFSVNYSNSSIEKADTNNGFYVNWLNDYEGYCCELGFMRTRFVWKDNQFVPIYEQEVKYLKIEPESQN